jgi:co-chaperonin GroES (HSP10)
MTKAAFAAHRITRDQLHPLNDSVIVSDMNFEERLSSGGIVLLTDNGKSSGIRPRWARVYAVGPDQHDIRIGSWVCVEHGRWTRGITVETPEGKMTLRKVDPNDILLVSDEPMEDETMSDKVY